MNEFMNEWGGHGDQQALAEAQAQLFCWKRSWNTQFLFSFTQSPKTGLHWPRLGTLGWLNAWGKLIPRKTYFLPPSPLRCTPLPLTNSAWCVGAESLYLWRVSWDLELPPVSSLRIFNPQLRGAAETLLSGTHLTGTNRPWCKDIHEAICSSNLPHATLLPRRADSMQAWATTENTKGLFSTALSQKGSPQWQRGLASCLALESGRFFSGQSLQPWDGDCGVGHLSLTTVSVTWRGDLG